MIGRFGYKAVAAWPCGPAAELRHAGRRLGCRKGLGCRNCIERRPAGRYGRRVNLRIVPAGAERDAFLPLLRLADDSEPAVRGYYQLGDLYAFGDDAGMVLALALPDGSVELKAVAVDAALHGRGIGTRMLRAVLGDLKARGVRRVVVGTANAGVGELAFYQKSGFRLWRIERDYFTPERGYPEEMVENGIRLRDMVWMDQELVVAEA
jgi:ribosomal protein S18 acetylase RimI-like enzyme